MPNFDSASHIRFFHNVGEVYGRYCSVLADLTVTPLEIGQTNTIIYLLEGLVKSVEASSRLASPDAEMRGLLCLRGESAWEPTIVSAAREARMIRVRLADSDQITASPMREEVWPARIGALAGCLGSRVPRCRAVHIEGGEGLAEHLLEGFDLLALRLGGCRVTMTLDEPSLIGADRLGLLRQLCDQLVVRDATGLLEVPEAIVIPRAVDVTSWPAAALPESSSPPGVIYLPDAEPDALGAAAIVVDNLEQPWYCPAAALAMGLGKVVVCRVDERLVDRLGSDPPVALATPSTLSGVLARLAVDADARRRLGGLARAYWQRTHSPAAVSCRWRDFFALAARPLLARDGALLAWMHQIDLRGRSELRAAAQAAAQEFKAKRDQLAALRRGAERHAALRAELETRWRERRSAAQRA